MAEKLDLDLIDSIASRFGAITASDAKAMIARIRELESASQPGGVEPQKWQPLTAAGQVSEGDKLSFTIGGKRYNQTVKCVLDAGTDREEVIYNMRKNFYFITSMAIDGSSSHKNVQVKRAAPSAGNGGAED